MKKTSLFIAVAMLVLLAAIMTPVTAQADTEKDRVITTSATSEVPVTPDRAQISIGVQTQNADVKIAQQENAVKMNTLVTSLQKAGIDPRDLQTSGYSIYPVYEDSSLGFGQKIKYYQVTNTLMVTVRDVNRTGEFIDIAVANGANQANGITFTVSDDLMRVARNEALQKAVGEARADADAVAAAVGVKILGVRDISVGGVSPPVVYDRYAASEMSAKAVPTPIQPGEIRVSAQVSITYLIL
jgi:uncharacterized protein YggE